MRTIMKKFLAAICIAVLIMTFPGMSVAAAEIPDYEAEDVSEVNDDAAVVNTEIQEEDSAAEVSKQQGADEAAGEDMAEADNSPAAAEDFETVEAVSVQEESGNSDTWQNPNNENEDAARADETISDPESVYTSKEGESDITEEELTDDTSEINDDEESLGNVTPILKDYPVGTGVKATVYLQSVPSMEDPTMLESTYDIEFTANNGTLSPDWKQMINTGLHENAVRVWISRVAAVSFYTSNGKFYLPADSTELFADMPRLSSIDLSNVDTSKVNTMNYMFRDCVRLTKANVKGLNTSSFWGLSIMGMFKNCRKLQTLDLSSWDTSMITSTYELFSGCISLESINLTGFKTTHVWNMADMFLDCHSLKELNLGSFDTKYAQDMSSMFQNCKSLKKLNLSNFRTPQVFGMDYMFSGCEALQELNISGFDTSNVTTMSHMYSQCYSLHNPGVSKFNTSKVTDMESMFEQSGVQSLNLKNFNTANVTEMSSMFNNCMGLTDLDLSSFNTSKVVHMDYIFADCYQLRRLNISSFDMSKAEQMQDTYGISQILHDCTNLECLQTPKKTVHEIFLYLNMYDTTGKLYKKIPKLSKSITLWNTPPQDISSATVSGISLSYGYSGNPYTPAFKVTLNSVELVADTDYSYEFTDNIYPGIAKLIITGKGHYKGTKVKTFEIVNCVSKVISGHTYMLIPKNNSKTAVCPYSGRMVNNTKIYITDQSQSEAMKWTAVKNIDGDWTFVNAKCELVMAVQQNSTALGKGVVLYERTGKKAQTWKLEKKSDNSFAIRNAVTGYSISMSHASALKGTTLSMDQTKSSGLQRFYIVETTPVDHSYDGRYTIHASGNTDYVINISGASKADGANVNLNLYSNMNSKKFQFKYSGGGYYRIENLNSGLVLTVKDNSPLTGANVIQSAWHSKEGQRWKVHKNTDGTVSLKNVNGTVLHLVGNKKTSGTNVVASKPASTGAQKWFLKKA